MARIEEKGAEFAPQFTMLTSVFKSFIVSVIGAHMHTSTHACAFQCIIDANGPTGPILPSYLGGDTNTYTKKV